MARVFPSGWRELQATGAAARELETLGYLEAGLSSDYTVYHGVHWTRVDQPQYAIFGEIDFVVVGPTGKILLIEQKTGFLKEGTEGLSKSYSGKEKLVASQIARNTDNFHRKLRQACPDAETQIESLLYCPDYTVRKIETAGIPSARIVDATRRDQLVGIICTILPALVSDADILTAKPRIHRFVEDQLQLVPDANAIVGEASQLYTRLASGLARWGRQIDFAPFRLRVIGTAGSGKTQLALAVYRDAIAAGRRPLYVCYNRPLADHINSIVPAGGEVTTYHHFADTLMRRQGRFPDFTSGRAFSDFEQFLDAYQPDEETRVDELIIDEGQDFHAGWCENLLRFLRPDGRAWWLEDPMQNLYGRPPVALSGWVSIRSMTNYRTPRDILDMVNRLLPVDQQVEAGSPLSGSEIEVVTYADATALVRETVGAITGAIGKGFKREHIAVITYRGREHSLLTPYDKIGPYALKVPTGQYDLFGNSIRSDGDVHIDSVLRFKGQAAPCVILTEIDFQSLDDKALRRIFVGATRATMKLILVASQRSAQLLLERFG